jgi:hypothetical protein
MFINIMKMQMVDMDINSIHFPLFTHAALKRKSKDWLALNQDNVSKWGDISISRLLFQ